MRTRLYYENRIALLTAKGAEKTGDLQQKLKENCTSLNKKVSFDFFKKFCYNIYVR